MATINKLGEIQPYPEERLVFEADKFHHVTTQVVDPILAAIHEARDMFKKDTGPMQGRWLGTVPILVAQQWAIECGAAIGTKAWGVYAKQKLKDGEWARLRVHG